jgi:hypothetical protein
MVKAMARKAFASLKAFQDYANQTGDAYGWEGMPACDKRRRKLSPDQYEIVDVRTSRGVRRAMLIPKATLQAESAIRRSHLLAKRAAKK